MSGDILTGLAAVLGTILVAYLGYKGAKFTASRAQEGVKQTSQVDAQESALIAWQALLKPYQERVAQLEIDLDTEREARARQASAISAEQDTQRETMRRLQSEVTRWQGVAKTIARWALQLRDEVVRLGGTVPMTPEELLTLQAIEDRNDRPDPPPST